MAPSQRRWQNTTSDAESGILTAVKKAAIAGAHPLIFYYHRLNRYSFNALAGALDSDAELAEWPISLAKTAAELQATAATAWSKHGHLVVALSVLTPQLEDVLELVRRLRSAYGSDITILAGGPHATADSTELLMSGVDIVFRGEAEVSFQKVLRRLAQGLECEDIAGTAVRRGSQIIVAPRARPVDLDSFASFSPRRGMLGPIEITRGCPFACSYCQTSHIFGTQPRHRSVSAIVRQAAMLCSRGRAVIRLLSPNAFSYGSPDGRRLNLSAMSELLAALRATVSPRGRIIFGYFPSEARPDHVTPETLDLLKQYADNDEIVIGAQSGSAHVLETCHRAHTAESVLQAVSLARKRGYKILVDFMFGLPGEMAGDVRETIALMIELAHLGARIHPHAFVPLPQTAFAAERPGRIAPEVIRVLRQLKQQGAIYGDWIVQRRLANHMVLRRRAPQEFQE
jgi:B12-binding domain/radical SAM domain protein